MSRVARQLQEEHGDIEGTLQAITAAAVLTLPHAAACGISYITSRSKVESRAWTSELPRLVDTLQQKLKQGPCMDAIWEEKVVRVDDVAADSRWPEFAAEASQLGVRSMVSFQLFVDDDQLGAMNLYSGELAAFDEESQTIGMMLASHAAIALVGAKQEANLRIGMENRDLIGQAKGILMERHKLTADQAFGLLVRTSSVRNRKINDIADELVNTGQLPAR